MGAGKHIVESVPGVILILLLGWAIVSNHGQASIVQSQPLPQADADQWLVRGEAAFDVMGQINVNLQDQLEIMLGTASGQLCVTSRFIGASKSRDSL